jgi:uncharacterized protein YceH (UPF0502 family)
MTDAGPLEAAATSGAGVRRDALLERVAALETEVAQLRAELDAMKAG